MELHIPVIVGTARPDRKSIRPAMFIYEFLQNREGITSELVDPKDFNLPFDGESEEVKDPKYTKITDKADAFVIVSPEYNHSFPGSLKRLLDSELKNYNHKAVALAGVSAGPWGGIRAIEALLGVVRELGLVVTHTDMMFTDSYNITEDILKKNYKERVEKAIDELIWMAIALKNARSKN